MVHLLTELAHALGVVMRYRSGLIGVSSLGVLPACILKLAHFVFRRLHVHLAVPRGSRCPRLADSHAVEALDSITVLGSPASWFGYLECPGRW